MDAISFLNTENNIPVTESVMNNKQLGMTLIELMITLLVVAVLVAVAAPSISTMLDNNRLLALSNQLVSAINYTRSEAVKRRYDVVMCVRNAAGSGCNSLGGFEQGWIIFVNCNPAVNSTLDTTNVCDTDGDGIADAPEDILQDSNSVVNNTSGNISIVSNSAGNQRLIEYLPSGNVINNATLTVQTGPVASPVPRYRVSMAPRTGRVTSCQVPAGATTC
jgi:type IV fimbrial biogenesis protein FimT